MIKRVDVIKIFSLIMWGTAIFAYFFQFPFKNIAGLIIPCLAVYLLLKINKLQFDQKTVFLLICFLICLTCSVAMALTSGTGITRIIRFLFVLLAIVFCSFVDEKNFKAESNIFVTLAVLKSVVIIAIALTLLMVGDFSFLRNWAWNNELGDIYFLNRFVPKVQVQGNALLLIALIVEYIQKDRITWKLLIILAGILFAGNFAYILGLGLFIVYILAKKVLPILRVNNTYMKALIGIVVVAYLVMVPYLVGKIEEKADVSNQTRVEQAAVLLDTNLFIGSGLGNYIEASTPTRDYDGDIYFELQTLYIINQIGIVGLVLFYAIIFKNIAKKGSEKVVLYLIYLIYAFWNPYCFDTTQMIATLLIINMIGAGVKHEKSNCDGVLSGQ